jgi:hypothetical protein
LPISLFRCASVLLPAPARLAAEKNRVLATLTANNALDRVEDRYAGPNTKLGISVISVWHITDHCGQLVEYLRLNGIVPPFTQKYGRRFAESSGRRLSDFPILRNPRFVRGRVADDSVIGAPKQITSFLR